MQVVTKPVRNLGNLLTFINELMNIKYLQAVFYSMPWLHKTTHIRKTKRSLETC